MPVAVVDSFVEPLLYRVTAPSVSAAIITSLTATFVTLKLSAATIKLPVPSSLI